MRIAVIDTNSSVTLFDIYFTVHKGVISDIQQSFADTVTKDKFTKYWMPQAYRSNYR